MEINVEFTNCCEKPDIIQNIDGLMVCTNCGTVSGKEFVGFEKRAYTAEEVKKRRRTEPCWRNYGPRTIIQKNSSDTNGILLQGKSKAFFNRLSKIQGSLINSLERNYWEARPKIKQYSRKLNVPDYIIETAWNIYKEVAKMKLTMGRSINSFVAASMYAAIRIHKFPRLLEEISENSLIPIRSIHKSLGLIVRHVFPRLNLKYLPISPKPLVYRFGSNLGLSVKIQKNASEMLHYSIKSGLNRIGKDPKGLAAAALYLAAKSSEERKTQKEIAEFAHITEVTLRTRAKQIRKFL